MKITLDKQGKNIVELGLEVEAEKVLRAYEQTCRTLSHKVKIPGFRPGKAPRRVLETTLGVDYIKDEALESLVPKLLGQAISQENLDIITQPEIDKCEFELGKPLHLHAKFEVRPEVKITDYLGLSVDVAETVVPADALESMLTNLVQSKATFQAVNDKIVAMGDNVLIDFDCFVDDKLIEGGSAKDVVLEVKAGNFVDNFCEQLIGHKNGENFELKVNFPENYRNKELAGKEANFKVNLKEVRNKVTPEINDELAVSVGYESLTELTQVLNDRLNQEVAEQNRQNVQKSVVEAVVKLASVDIPETMIERELNLLIEQVKNYMDTNKQDFETFKVSKEFEDLKNVKLNEAKQRVLTSLVLGAIVRDLKLTVSQEELTPYFVELMTHYNVQASEITNNENIRRQVMEEALTSKVINHLVQNSQINYLKVEVDSAVS